MSIFELEDYLKSIDYSILDLEQLYNYIKCVTELEKTKYEIGAEKDEA